MKNKKLVLTLLAIFIVLCSFFLSRYFYKSHLKSNSKSQTITLKNFTIKQIIAYGGNHPDEENIYDVKQGESVLDLLSRTKKIEIKEYSFGKLVESITGVKNGKDKKYWIYYVNGQEAKVGAGDYKLKAGDKITWKFKAYEQQ